MYDGTRDPAVSSDTFASLLSLPDEYDPLDVWGLLNSSEGAAAFLQDLEDELSFCIGLERAKLKAMKLVNGVKACLHHLRCVVADVAEKNGVEMEYRVDKLSALPVANDMDAHTVSSWTTKAVAFPCVCVPMRSDGSVRCAAMLFASAIMRTGIKLQVTMRENALLVGGYPDVAMYKTRDYRKDVDEFVAALLRVA